MSSTSLWARYKKRLLTQHEMNCFYCGKSLIEFSSMTREEAGKRMKDVATVDHIVPQSKGGTNALDNLVPCCFSCNAKKKDKDRWDAR